MAEVGLPSSCPPWGGEGANPIPLYKVYVACVCGGRSGHFISANSVHLIHWAFSHALFHFTCTLRAKKFGAVATLRTRYYTARIYQVVADTELVASYSSVIS